MANFKKAFKAGVEAMMAHDDKPSGSRYSTSWQEIRCTQCDGERFSSGHALLNTAGLTFVGLDWLNRQAILLVCDRCSAIQWFAGPVTELEDLEPEAGQHP
jgi:hypothetical protein